MAKLEADLAARLLGNLPLLGRPFSSVTVLVNVLSLHGAGSKPFRTLGLEEGLWLWASLLPIPINVEFKGLSRVFFLSAGKVLETQMFSVGDVARGLRLASGFCFHSVCSEAWMGHSWPLIALRVSSVLEVSLCLEGDHTLSFTSHRRMSWVEGTTLI